MLVHLASEHTSNTGVAHYVDLHNLLNNHLVQMFMALPPKCAQQQFHANSIHRALRFALHYVCASLDFGWSIVLTDEKGAVVSHGIGDDINLHSLQDPQTSSFKTRAACVPRLMLQFMRWFVDRLRFDIAFAHVSETSTSRSDGSKRRRVCADTCDDKPQFQFNEIDFWSFSSIRKCFALLEVLYPMQPCGTLLKLGIHICHVRRPQWCIMVDQAEEISLQLFLRLELHLDTCVRTDAMFSEILSTRLEWFRSRLLRRYVFSLVQQ